MSIGLLNGLIAQSLTKGEKLGRAFLELAEGVDLSAVMGNLGRIAEAAGNGSPLLVFEGIEGVGTAADLLTITDGLNELLSNGTSADLLKVFDLGEELTAAGMELFCCGLIWQIVVFNTTLFRVKKGEKL